MPSINQMKSTQNYDPNKPAVKNPKKTFMKAAIAITVVAGIIIHYVKPKIATIPDEMLAAQSESMFQDIFATPVKKILWFGADCPVSARKKQQIDIALRYYKLDKHYQHMPHLQNSFMIHCFDCLDSFVMEHCASGICIILPNSKKIIQTTEDKLIKNLEKYKNY